MTVRLALLMFALILTFQINAAPLTPHDAARIRNVIDARISPNGKDIAYLLAVPRKPGKDENGPSYVELHVVDAKGNSRPYITGEVNISSIEWTRDGSSISYLAKRAGDKQKSLYRIPFVGGESQTLLTHKTAIDTYSWSPDGNQVAFIAAEPEPKELEEAKKQGFNQQIYEEDYRPARVWITSVNPSTEEPEEPRMLELPGSASAVKWSPANDRLAVALAPTPLVDDSFMRKLVHIVDVKSGKVTAKLDHAAKLGDFAWRPNGRQLITLSGQDINDPREGRILLWRANGKLQKTFLEDYIGHAAAITWRNNNTISFIGSEWEWTTLNQIDLKSGARTIIQKTGGPILHTVSISPKGITALVADSPSHPMEVYRLGKSGEPASRLTTSNPWLATIDLAKQEAIRHTARDGLELGGVLVRPLNEKEDTRYPLIMAVHGGPESCVPNGWVTSYSHPGQFGAAESMAVFYPNYRGSTGRGIKFSKISQADAAGAEFDDIVDAIDHLVKSGLVNRKKVGITGASYGGYASAWGATKLTEHYAASVMFVGISDNLSKVGTTDIPDEMYHVHHRKRLWDDWNYYLERSPIRYVEQSRTPILILHGKDDPRVHPAQSLELHRHLKTLGKTPVRLVLYPGEGHGNRRAASRLDYSLRLMRWMNHYLKGDDGDPPPYPIDYGIE